jgi:hypothetical protein
MSDSDKPPLDPRVYEQIEMVMFQVDQRHWPFIAAMRVPRSIPLDEPVPPQLPHHFLNQVQWYASMLLKAEADQYEQFRNDKQYPEWLAKLTERILDRVLRTVDRIEQGKLDETLLYHGVTKLQIIFAVRGILRELTNPYTGGIAHLPTPVEMTEIERPAVQESPAPEVIDTAQPSDRKALRDSYLAAFPDAKFRDICWAAQQHYREWRRWLNGEIKDGLKPDRAFRRVLISGKSPQELVRKPRPPKWE